MSPVNHRAQSNGNSATMSIFYHVLLGLHFVGLASIVLGYFLELNRKTFGISPAMLHGASLQVATGLLMVDLRAMNIYKVDEPLNFSIVFVKFAVTIAILIACVYGRRAGEDTKKFWAFIGIATLVNATIASMAG